ncbi:MAG: hypothetical protein ACRDT1_12365 [Micromonosporaceae bacterium]
MVKTASWLLVVLLLATGGYFAYLHFASKLGLGYATGGAATINQVTFTVTAATCGLRTPPGKEYQPTKAQFCTIDLDIANKSNARQYLVLSLFEVRLDPPITVGPATAAMQELSVELARQQLQHVTLVYDLWDGVQMRELLIRIGYQAERISLV